ncbi:MAG: Zn-ribbon containing protein [Methanolinea sp.]|nr:Zn-ribbon containing protein [Methanolinea sp.]
MPHKCARCGREYRTNECEILRGCRECGGKKFVFIPRVERTAEEGEGGAAPVPAPVNAAPVAAAAGEEEGEPQPEAPLLGADRLESIRIVAPGTYELNIEKLAMTDERVVGIGRGEGSYLVDLLSMVRSRKKKPKK